MKVACWKGAIGAALVAEFMKEMRVASALLCDRAFDRTSPRRQPQKHGKMKRRKLVPLMVLLLLAAACERSGLRNRVISSGNRGAYEVSLVADSRGFAAAWYDTRHGNAEVYMALLTADGALRGPEIRITRNNDSSYEPHLVWSGGTFGLVWYEVRGVTGDHSGGGGTSMFAVVSEDGRVRRMLPLDDKDTITRNPLVLTDGRVFCATWLKENRADGGVLVMARLFGLDGHPQGDAVALGLASGSTWNLNGAFLPEEGIKIVFDASYGTVANEIFIIEATPDLKIVRQVRLTPDDGIDSRYPDIFWDRSRLGLVWWERHQGSNEVFFSLRHHDTALLTPMRLTHNFGDSVGAYLSALEGRFAVAWSDDTPGNYEIYLALIDPDEEQHVPFLRVTEARYRSSTPSIARRGNCLGLAWNDMRDNSVANDEDASKIYFQTVCSQDLPARKHGGKASASPRRNSIGH